MMGPCLLIICLVQKVHDRVSSVSSPHEIVLWFYKFILHTKASDFFNPPNWTALRCGTVVLFFQGLANPHPWPAVTGDAVADSLFGRTSCLLQWRWGAPLASKTGFLASWRMGKLCCCPRRNVNELKNTLRGSTNQCLLWWLVWIGMNQKMDFFWDETSNSVDFTWCNLCAYSRIMDSPKPSKLVKQCWTFVVGVGDPGSVIIGSILWSRTDPEAWKLFWC